MQIPLLEVLEEVLAYGFIKSSTTTLNKQALTCESGSYGKATNLTSRAGEHSQLALVKAARRNLAIENPLCKPCSLNNGQT